MLYIFLLTVVSAYTQLEYETSFKSFLQVHNKIYEGEELERKFSVFKSNMNAVFEHNNRGESWTVGINKFSDLTSEEFSNTMLGYLGKVKRNSSESVPEDFKEIDWRSKGAITPIKDQGLCGSCWAFSTTGGVEGSEYIDGTNHNGDVISLSEQALVDCSGEYGNQGCNGGLMDDAFKYIKAHGIPSEQKYPYLGYKQKCKKVSPITKITGFTDVTNLEQAIQKQPVSVAVDARKWSNYNSGVFKCKGGVQLDHGVLLVASYSNYWVIKNSWGDEWGLKGYIQLSKDSSHNCGVDKSASYPSGAKVINL